MPNIPYGACRSCDRWLRTTIYALSPLGLNTIFLLDRVDEEIEYLSEPEEQKNGLIHLKNPIDVEQYLAKPLSPVVLMAVGV